MTDEELKLKLKHDQDEFEKFKSNAMNEDMLDSDGYPTDILLELVEKWHFSDIKGWFEFIKSFWWASGWGWKEKEEPHDYKKDTLVYRYYISTGGWSGNESIIRSMQKNYILWNFAWVQSRRGGHYIFETMPNEN